MLTLRRKKKKGGKGGGKATTPSARVGREGGKEGDANRPGVTLEKKKKTSIFQEGEKKRRAALRN